MAAHPPASPEGFAYNGRRRMEIISEAVAYRDGETELNGELFWDHERPNKRPGVLVVHGGGGLDDHSRGRAWRMAELGFVAFAGDMYGKGVRGDRQCIMARIAELRASRQVLCRCAQAGMEVLTSRPQVDGRIAAVGYCFGGMTVLEMARSGAELDAVVSVHGSLQTAQPAERGNVHAKILVCHGALDPHVPAPHVTTFMEEMDRAGADWQLNVYGGALHGFTHEAPSSTPGVAYNAVADSRSSAAIKSFFAEVFGETKEAFLDALTPLRATP